MVYGDYIITPKFVKIKPFKAFGNSIVTVQLLFTPTPK